MIRSVMEVMVNVSFGSCGDDRALCRDITNLVLVEKVSFGSFGDDGALRRHITKLVLVEPPANP